MSVADKPLDCVACKKRTLHELNRYCGAWVCTGCGYHHKLARCFCGWAADGGNGRRQLEDMGETIDPEDY